MLARAREVLSNLEAMAVDPDSRPRIARGGKKPATWQLSLFAPAAVPGAPDTTSSSTNDPGRPATADPQALAAAAAAAELAAALGAVDPDTLTPRAALELVYRLKSLVRERRA